jgi:hypothetical protein
MKIAHLLPIACLCGLAACASPDTGDNDVAARGRPPAQRCAQFYGSARAASAPMTAPNAASVSAETRAAARRGELDAICAYY